MLCTEEAHVTENFILYATSAKWAAAPDSENAFKGE